MLTTSAFVAFIQAYTNRLDELQPLLDQLDNQIGDGDHGTNMTRGFHAANERLTSTPTDDLGALSQTVAMTLLSSVGGASGPLYATVFLRFSAQWKGQSQVDAKEITEAIVQARDGLVVRGKAHVGEKTMIDVWSPAAQTLQENPTVSGLLKAATVAAEAAVGTRELVAGKGRAAYLGERSRGTCDPGSVSSAVFFEEFANVIVGGVEKTPWPTLVS
ncbi:dihydroxyacetone kinase subunit DhaL [Alicyclobacillus acidoterrestris]|uniref:dihydroxyacetone kinase subunit DhaL n=1 Tax=Alicyclobacillus TaxID=29330 RepID=UPI001A8CD1F7|nr:dihydroxyacetone kinase subunit DhaL [Alicyclobacillus suci]